MKVKTFTGSSLSEAIVKAKQEFGSNIILLESKQIPASRTKNGTKLAQITVSVDPEQPVPQKNVEAWAPPRLDTKRPQVTTAKSPTKGDNDFNKVIQDILAKKPKVKDQENKILDELASLKDQINQLQANTKSEPTDALPAFYSEVRDEMMDKGMQQKLADRLIRRAYSITENGPTAGKQEIIESVIIELKNMFKAYNYKKKAPKKKNKVVLMVGGTGAGKTTSAMKLAAHQEIFGKKEVLVVSTDLYGPTEALKAFSKMNGTEVLDKKRVDELEKLMKSAEQDVVIVDTPGESPFAPNYLKKLEEYVKAVKPSDIFLVLPMTTDLKDMYLSAALYMLLKPSGIILTKFDETAQPGKLFSIIDELKLPVAGIADGKRIFIDMQMPNADYAIHKLFDMNRGA